MSLERMEQLLRSAFAQATLAGGISLKQGEIIDRLESGATDAQFKAIARGENTTDWTALTLEQLENYPYLAHVDARGFRYYIAAFMLSVLRDYAAASMRVISTLHALYPKQGAWAYHMEQYSLLDENQKRAIALYLSELPRLVALDVDDAKIVSRGLRNYWGQFLSGLEKEDVA